MSTTSRTCFASSGPLLRISDIDPNGSARTSLHTVLKCVVLALGASEGKALSCGTDGRWSRDLKIGRWSCRRARGSMNVSL